MAGRRSRKEFWCTRTHTLGRLVVNSSNDGGGIVEGNHNAVRSEVRMTAERAAEMVLLHVTAVGCSKNRYYRSGLSYLTGCWT